MTPGFFELTLYKGSTFGPVVLTAYVDAERTILANLTGYTAHAKVRETANGPVIRDLLPTITDGPNGVVTIPAITDEVTKSSALPRGTYMWDLLLETSGGAVIGPFLAGPFNILLPISR